MEEGFLFFVRLIGTMNFKKYLAEFTLDTPRALYMSLSQDPIEQHKMFIEVIRESVWSRIEFEDELPPPLIPCGASASEPVGFQICGISLPKIM